MTNKNDYRAIILPEFLLEMYFTSSSSSSHTPGVRRRNTRQKVFISLLCTLEIRTEYRKSQNKPRCFILQLSRKINAPIRIL